MEKVLKVLNGKIIYLLFNLAITPNAKYLFCWQKNEGNLIYISIMPSLIYFVFNQKYLIGDTI